LTVKKAPLPFVLILIIGYFDNIKKFVKIILTRFKWRNLMVQKDGYFIHFLKVKRIALIDVAAPNTMLF